MAESTYSTISLSVQPPTIIEVIASKPWYESKTVWVNVIALVALIVQTQYGFVMSPEIQGAILILANMVLRAVTTKEIV